MALLTVQTVTKDGITATYAAAAAAGDTFANNGKTFIIVKNANVSTARTVTIDSLTSCNYGHDHNIAVSVPASSEKWIGPFETTRFNSAAGIVTATYSSEADLTVAAVSI